MTIEAVTPTSDIDGDFLIRIDGLLIRARVTRTTPDAAILAAVERAVEVVNFKFQCSVAADESGDVKKDCTGSNIIFPAEVHGFGLEALAGGQSVEAWIADRLEAMVEKARKKAFFQEQIAARYPLPAPAVAAKE